MKTAYGLGAVVFSFVVGLSTAQAAEQVVDEFMYGWGSDAHFYGYDQGSWDSSYIEFQTPEVLCYGYSAPVGDLVSVNPSGRRASVWIDDAGVFWQCWGDFVSLSIECEYNGEWHEHYVSNGKTTYADGSHANFHANSQGSATDCVVEVNGSSSYAVSGAVSFTRRDY